MATITRTLTPAQEAAFAAAVVERNQRAPVPLTMDDLLASIVDGAIADLVADQQGKAVFRRSDAYNRLVPEDQAAVDAILAKAG